MRKSVFIGSLLLVLVSFLTVACSSHSTLSDSLANKGVVPLSHDNAYVGANLFLSEEAQKSQLLYQFLKRKGAPQAIELDQGFTGALSMRMYYIKATAEFYKAELQKNDTRYEWVVNGPFSISRGQFTEIRGMLDANNSEPILLLRDREAHLGPTPTPIPTATPTRVPPKPTPVKKKIIVKKHLETPAPSVTIALPTPTAAAIDFNAPLNSDQLAIMRAKGYAERSNGGDLVHTVKSAAETVDVLVQWYTGSKQNSAAVLKYNALPENATLAVGQKLVIPKTLVIQPKEMK